jgi:hypothetical protein
MDQPAYPLPQLGDLVKIIPIHGIIMMVVRGNYGVLEIQRITEEEEKEPFMPQTLKERLFCVQ